jgi:predicted transcriptional regulator
LKEEVIILGTRTWKSVRDERLTPRAVERAKRRARERIDAVTLQELRQDFAMTQIEVARAADMTQSELSRLESRADHRISTLRRYVDALGGKLEITAVFGKRRVKLTDV